MGKNFTLVTKKLYCVIFCQKVGPVITKKKLGGYVHIY